MQIILNPEESTDHLRKMIHEAVLAETSKFPANMKPPEGCNLRPKPLSDESKTEIKRLHDAGMRRDQIAKELNLPVMQVGGVVQAYIMNVLRKLPVEPKIEGLQPVQPLVMPEAEKPPIEPTCSSCGKSLSRDKVAIEGKMYCSQGCAPKKVPVMVAKRPKPIKSSSMIDSLIVDMASKPPIEIADVINRRFGGSWMPEDVTKRLKELRSRE
jgi:hypothetical protein